MLQHKQTVQHGHKVIAEQESNTGLRVGNPKLVPVGKKKQSSGSGPSGSGADTEMMQTRST